VGCGERFTTYERPAEVANELARAVVAYVRSLDPRRYGMVILPTR
jgi:hypothetical protein